MGRRADHTREELYEAALAAAWKIGAKEGLRGLTARRIADAIGYSPGTLYNIFEDLDDLIVHLLGRILDRLYEACAQAPMKGEPEAKLRALAKIYIGFTTKWPRLWNLLFEHSVVMQELPDQYRERVDRLLGLVGEALDPLFDPGREEERRHSARVLWASLQGICSIAAAGRLAPTETLGGMVDSLVTNYVAGLRASPGER